jgi:hypothetical protein
MAYKFQNQQIPETLDHAPEFKKEIDKIITSCKFATSVGWRPDTEYQLFDLLQKNNINCYVVEIFAPHCGHFRFTGVKKIHGDVKNYKDYIPVSHRDCLIWQDGPENLEMNEAKNLLKGMQKEFNIIVIATPNGFKEQGAYMENDNEANRSHWYAKDYEELGFKFAEYLPGNSGLIGFWINPNPIRHEVIEEFKEIEYKKLNLPEVTLVCADTTYYHSTMNAFHWNLAQCNFADVVLFTDDRFDEMIPNQDKVKELGIRIHKIPTIRGKNGDGSYSWFMLKEIYKHISTKFFLITQGDGWIINPDAWTDEFYNYDYIGSKWSFHGPPENVGNGGFSLRTTRLHTITGADSEVSGNGHAEDTTICKIYRHYLYKKYGLTIAPPELADKFSYDHLPCPGKTFGFHYIETRMHESMCISKYGCF